VVVKATSGDELVAEEEGVVARERRDQASEAEVVSLDDTFDSSKAASSTDARRMGDRGTK
jgi:hypothetical protein